LALEGDGGNGKSVFINGIQAIIGASNMSSVGLNELGERFKAFSTLGKMLNVCHEANDLDMMAESTLKHFTGGDPMSFEQKGKDPIEMRPTAKLMCTWNEPPRFKDKTEALWRRMLIVRFTRKVENPDTRLLDPNYWYQQNEVAGMLNWALAGLQRISENNGFTITQEMRNAVEDVRVATNSARKFIKEFYEYSPSVNGISAKIACKTLYKRYTEWCHEGNHKPFNEVHFGREMKSVFKTLVVRERGIADDFDGRVWCYFNVQERNFDSERV
jgi:putative DNA primase/helicase